MKLGNHREITPQSWWQKVMSKVLGSEPWRRVKIGAKGTFLLPVKDVPEYCLKKLGKNKKLKLYLSYAAFKPGKGQSEGDVQYPIKRVLDFDTKGVATEKQFLQLSAMFPGCYLIWTNGIQVFFAPSGSKDDDAHLLDALGKKAEKRSRLSYDGHSLTKAGRPAKYQSHPYRAPWGWASRANRPNRCFEPVKGEWTVQDAAKALGVTVSVPTLTAPSPAATKPAPRHKSTKPSGTGKRSQPEEHVEFIAILQHRRALLKAGKTLAKAKAASLAHGWLYHTAEDIERIYTDPKYVANLIGKGGGTTKGGAINLQGVLSDHQALTFQTGPETPKRSWLQTGKEPYLQRAWSFQWLYQLEPAFAMTEDEAIAAFMEWSEFAFIRELSLKNLGREELEVDLRRLWNYYRNYQGRADYRFVRAVREQAAILKTFTRAKIARLVPKTKSRRTLQRALNQLVAEGVLRMIGCNKGAKYEVTTLPASAPTTPPKAPATKKPRAPKAVKLTPDVLRTGKDRALARMRREKAGISAAPAPHATPAETTPQAPTVAAEQAAVEMAAPASTAQTQATTTEAPTQDPAQAPVASVAMHSVPILSQPQPTEAPPPPARATSSAGKYVGADGVIDTDAIKADIKARMEKMLREKEERSRRPLTERELAVVARAQEEHLQRVEEVKAQRKKRKAKKRPAIAPSPAPVTAPAASVPASPALPPSPPLTALEKLAALQKALKKHKSTRPPSKAKIAALLSAPEPMPADESNPQWVKWRWAQIKAKGEADDEQMRNEGYSEAYIQAVKRGEFVQPAWRARPKTGKPEVGEQPEQGGD